MIVKLDPTERRKQLEEILHRIAKDLLFDNSYSAIFTERRIQMLLDLNDKDVLDFSTLMCNVQLILFSNEKTQLILGDGPKLEIARFLHSTYEMEGTDHAS